MRFDQERDVHDADILSLVRLAGEISEIRRGVLARREHVLAELATLCDADKAVFAEFCRCTRTGNWLARPATALFYNTPDHEKRLLRRFYDHNEPADPVIEVMGSSGEAVLVGRPTDLLSDRVWRSSAHYNEVRRPAGIVEQIYAHHCVGDVACGIGLHRRDARPFGRREVRLVDSFMRGAGQSLHNAAIPAAISAANPSSDTTAKPESSFNAPIEPQRADALLPPRLAAVLERFMLGETEKAAARHLGVTHHTVHSYAKQLYRRLGVSSRSELLARYIPRSGAGKFRDGKAGAGRDGPLESR